MPIFNPLLWRQTMMTFQERLTEVNHDLYIYTKQHPVSDPMEYLTEQLAASHNRFYFLADKHDELHNRLKQRKTDTAILEEAIQDKDKQLNQLKNNVNIEQITNNSLHKQIDEMTDQLNTIEEIINR